MTTSIAEASISPDSNTVIVNMTDSNVETMEPPPLLQDENIKKEAKYYLKLIQSVLNLLAHIFIGFTVGVVLVFVFQNKLPLGATRMHILLCVLGYHLLMAQAILSMSSDNCWSSKLKFVNRRRTHWILQVGGSSLAIAGTSIKIIDKQVHWTSLHGQFGLVALVFTSVSLFNGLCSLWANEFRRITKIINGNITKITHICFGIIAFCASTICLCLGIKKPFFKNWTTEPFGNALITIIFLYAFIVIVNPTISLFIKTRSFIKK